MSEIDEVFKAIETRDVNTLIELSSQLSSHTFDEFQRLERMKNIDKSLGVTEVKISNIELISEKDTTKQYTAVMKYDTDYGTFEKTGNFEFTKNDTTKQWELNWTPEVIIPGLKASNEVRIENIESKRGQIVDRNNVPLAIDGKHFQVGLDTATYNQKHNEKVAKLLEMEEETIENTINSSWVDDGMFVPLKTFKEIPEAIGSNIKDFNLIIQETKGRTYPLDESAAHLMGYVGPINADELKTDNFKGYSENAIVGKTGLERKYDRELQNKDGLKVYITQDNEINGKEDLLIYDEPKNGKTIRLTIDSRVQKSIYNHLKDDNGSGTAMHPETGDMLALVSYPSYSPYDFMFGVSHKEYEELTEDPMDPLLNKFQVSSSPGSTQKIITAIIGLNNGMINEDTAYQIEGKGWQKDSSWGGYQMTRYKVINGQINLEQAITSSDNIYFGRSAIDMGGEEFVKGMKMLGVGEEIPSDYPFYTGQIANPENLKKNIDNEILLGDSAYGQGEILISPAQILSIYSALINEGDMMVPRVNQETQIKPWKNNITSIQNIELLTKAMRRVVSETERESTERPYATFAGKTGTAELKMTQHEGYGNQIGWFIGYDMDNPNMMLAINIKNVEDKGMSTYNAQKFSRIMDDLYSNGNKIYSPDKE